jgi:aminoglycoside phosphotransferase (APT) family kinase protein
VRAEDTQRAVAAAGVAASSLGLTTDGAAVLNDSNRIVVRLMPCDVVARVTSTSHHAGHHASARREVAVVDRLERIGAPVAGLDPRVGPQVIERNGFEITFWTHHAPVDRPLPAASYARTLVELHAGLRRVDLPLPHVTDRIAAVEHDVASRVTTPGLGKADRASLADALRDLRRSIVDRGAPEQPLHGEPHPWNVHVTAGGPLLIDFENAARGPVEYDLAWVPSEVALHSDADPALLDVCRGLVLAMIAAYRHRHDDEHPSGPVSGHAFLAALRSGPPWPTLDTVTW